MGAIINGMGLHPSNMEVQRIGCNALDKLATGGEACLQALLEAGLIDATLRAMRSHESESQVQRNALGALIVVSRSDDIDRKRAIASGVILGAVANAMSVHAKDVSLQGSGCILFSQISSGDDMCRQAAVDAGGVALLEAAVSLLSSADGTMSEQMKQAAADPMATIARLQPTADAPAEMAGMATRVAALQLGEAKADEEADAAQASAAAAGQTGEKDE